MRRAIPLCLVFACSLLVACGSDESDGGAAGAAGAAAGMGGGAGAAGAVAGMGGAAGVAGAAGAAGGASGGGGAGASGGGAAGASGGAAGASGGAAGAAAVVVGGDRPTTVHVPPSYDGTTPLPLVMMLHGYSASGVLEDAYLKLTAQSDALGFLYVRPDGLTDKSGKKYWNATAACCDFDGTNVDDEAYLMGVVAEIQQKLKVDPKRIYLFGHSNGGFMSYRLACNHADTFSAIGILAGAMNVDPAACKPSKPVSVLHIHGTADATISYDGGKIGISSYPPAATSIADWVANDGCDGAPDTSAAPLDLDSTLAGAETTVDKYKGCKQSSAVEHWKIVGGAHVPTFTSAFAPAAASWLLAH